MFIKYFTIAAFFALTALLNSFAPHILEHLTSLPGIEPSIALALWCISLFLGMGWACSKLSEGTVLPNFTLQLIVGVLLHDALSPIASNIQLVVVLCTALAAIILKGGGDEIERSDFGTIAYPTLMIAIVGFLITFMAMYGMLRIFKLDGVTAALLAAIISSTDPAALIPTLKKLSFKAQHKKLSNIAVAESAVNDSVGAIITAALTTLVLAGNTLENSQTIMTELAAPENLTHLGFQLFFGVVAGLFGWGCMYSYERYRSNQAGQQLGETNYDFGIILGVPLLTFLLAEALHGNGFLAAFIAGLMANYNHSAERFHTTLHTMEIKIESIAKPTIFMMVGPFVALGDLLDTALLGFGISLAFIAIARPLAVFGALLPTNLSWNERSFLCIIRETGVIPVVLAVITVAQLPQLTLLMPLTAWVVIWTLSLLPALTPWWARKLKLLID